MAKGSKSATAVQAEKAAAESAEYEAFTEDLAEKAEAFRAGDEPAIEFARRMVGLMRMHSRKWAEAKR